MPCCRCELCDSELSAQTQIDLSLVLLPDVATEQRKEWDVCYHPAVVGNVITTSDEIICLIAALG